MDKQTKEYNSFGPWVTAIHSEEDITHGFIHVKDELLNSEVAFKVPIEEEKSSVKEGMILYDKAVALHLDTITIYRLIDDAVYSSTIKLHDIIDIKLTDRYIHCNLMIATHDMKLSFNFNGVSSLLLKKFITLIDNHRYVA